MIKLTVEEERCINVAKAPCGNPDVTAFCYKTHSGIFQNTTTHEIETYLHSRNCVEYVSSPNMPKLQALISSQAPISKQIRNRKAFSDRMCTSNLSKSTFGLLQQASICLGNKDLQFH